MFENLVFLNPYAWIFSFILWMIFLFLAYKTKNFKLNFKFYEDLEKIFWNKNHYFKIFLSFIFIIITLFSIIIANPNLKTTTQETKKNWIDIVLVLDLSYSMMAQDITPNRLEMAKKVINDFIWKLQTDRVWMVVFSWKPFVWVPLTFDYKFIESYVSKLDMNTINQDYSHLQWTAIWDGILYWANLFEAPTKSWSDGETQNEQENREKVIVLLTDGEANRWIEPITAVRYTKDKNIKIHTVWIWGYEDTYVELNWPFWKERVEIWWVDEKILKSIASLTNWKYYRASDNKTFSELFENLNLLQKNEIKVNEFVSFTPYYSLFIYLLALFWFLFIAYYFYYFLKN